MANTGERNYLFDNIKAMLIFMVIWVHFCSAAMETYGGNMYIEITRVIIKGFFMPLFMIISGYFSKHTTKQKVNRLLMDYFVMCCLFFVEGFFILHSIHLSSYTLWDFLSPGFSMWYFFAIIVLKVFFMEMPKLKWGILLFLLASVLISVVSVEGAMDVAISRTIAFSVYFAVGYNWSEKVVERIRRVNKLLPAAILVLWVIVMSYVGTHILSVTEMHTLGIIMTGPRGMDNFLWGCGLYLGLILLAFLLSICIIAVMPERKTLFSVYGKNSLTIYFAQALLFGVYRALLKGTSYSQLTVYLITTGVSILIFLIFGRNFIASGYNRFVNFLYRTFTKLCIKENRDA